MKPRLESVILRIARPDDRINEVSPSEKPPYPARRKRGSRRNRRYRTAKAGNTIKVFKMNPDGTKGEYLRSERDHSILYSKLEETWQAPYPREP